jgi:hypothetical protein
MVVVEVATEYCVHMVLGAEVEPVDILVTVEME